MGTMFDIGDLAKCVYDFPNHPWVQLLGYVAPVPGTIYTVRDVVYGVNGMVGLLLDEVRNDKIETEIGRMEVGFDHMGFVPVRSDRIDVFRRIAMGQDQDDREKEPA